MMQSRLMGQIDVASSGLLVRRPTGRQDAFIGSWNLSSYKSKVLQFTTDVPANLMIAIENGHSVLSNGGDSTIQIRLQQPFLQTISLLPSHSVELDSKESHPIDGRSLFNMPADSEESVLQ
jgi:hypothetical protein